VCNQSNVLRACNLLHLITQSVCAATGSHEVQSWVLHVSSTSNGLMLHHLVLPQHPHQWSSPPLHLRCHRLCRWTLIAHGLHQVVHVLHRLLRALLPWCLDHWTCVRLSRSTTYFVYSNDRRLHRHLLPLQFCTPESSLRSSIGPSHTNARLGPSSISTKKLKPHPLSFYLLCLIKITANLLWSLKKILDNIKSLIGTLKKRAKLSSGRSQ
jgi:hypothetical protein